VTGISTEEKGDLQFIRLPPTPNNDKGGLPLWALITLCVVGGFIGLAIIACLIYRCTKSKREEVAQQVE
jgi:hypothetical protein